MTIILDTHIEIFIAADTADLQSQLLSLLPEAPTIAQITELAAAVLGCDTLDIIITHSN